MKTLAMLGGMGYSATSIYYCTINEYVQKKLGGSSSATLLIHSFNHSEMGKYFTSGQWDDVVTSFVGAGRALKAAGAEGLLICCNTGHKVAEEVERQVDLRLLHIADPVGEAVRNQGLTRVILLGTKAVMEGDFFVTRLQQKFGIEVVVPTQPHRDNINDIIFTELSAHIFSPSSKQLLIDIVKKTIEAQGAEGVILACTELQFMIKPDDVPVPLWDTLELHALHAARWMLDD